LKTVISRHTIVLLVSQEDLVGLRRELESEAQQLQEDRGKQERLATTITNQMQADAQVMPQQLTMFCHNAHL